MLTMVVSGAAAQVMGVGISLLGQCVTISGLNAQKWAIGQEGGSGGPRWCLAFFVFICGEVLQAMALAYATQEVLSAVSNMSIVFNAIIAAAIFGEPFTVCPPNFHGSTE